MTIYYNVRPIPYRQQHTLRRFTAAKLKEMSRGDMIIEETLRLYSTPKYSKKMRQGSQTLYLYPPVSERSSVMSSSGLLSVDSIINIRLLIQ